MRRSFHVLFQLLVLTLAGMFGGFVAGSQSDTVTANRGGMSAAVPMMSLAEVRAATAASSTDLATTTITPVRIVDTRPGAGALGGAKVPWQAMETRTVEAAGLGSIPADAVGVVVNVTALNATTSDTFLTLFPTGSVMPNASTLNPPLGQVAFNAATVLLGPDGAFEVYNYSGTVDVIVDVTAYMTRTLAESVEVVESDVGRLSSGQPLLSLRDAGSNSFFFDALGYSDWTNYRLSDQSGLFGAPIEIGRYSEAATVELRVAARIPESDEFELCFAIHSTLDGLISESEVCVDSNSEEAADGIALVASQRVPIPVEGFMSPYVKVKPRDGATCPKNPDNQYSLCVGYMEWFGFYVYD